MISAKIDKYWVRCSKCGHKLFKINTEMPMFEILNDLDRLQIEIKCHSCKTINRVGGENDE